MDLLFIILSDSNIQIEVKNYGISAIGDICLVIEHEFIPYFKKTMDVLILAGQ